MPYSLRNWMAQQKLSDAKQFIDVDNETILDVSKIAEDDDISTFIL